MYNIYVRIAYVDLNGFCLFVYKFPKYKAHNIS